MFKGPKSRRSARRARAAGKTTVLGGPSVSASPEQYPEFDYLHIGELGDATDELIRAIDEDASPPAAQQRFATRERLALAEFPIPAYELIDGRRYFIGSVQFSSGCPYRCEFCDIPALYGRQPRLKTPQQILAELDALLAAGIKTSIYFVDDNFIGNKKAARELLPHLVAWQKRRGYPVQLCCEATLNIAKSPGDFGDDARGLFLHGLLRHRVARAGRARRHAEIAEPRSPVAGRGRNDQQLRHRGRLGDHTRSRHRHAADR